MKKLAFILIAALVSCGEELEEQTCTATETVVGVLISCPDGSGGMLDYPEYGGTVIEVVDPCGAEREDGLDEVLLRTNSGQILGVLTDRRGGIFLAAVAPGDYVTTDGTNCRFNVSETGVITES